MGCAVCKARVKGEMMICVSVAAASRFAAAAACFLPSRIDAGLVEMQIEIALAVAQ
jgi:hypothetical protein